MSEQRRTGIILGEYKGLQVPGFDRTITDEDVMESLRRLQAQNVYHQEVEGRPVQNGDIATIDYEGFYKGKPFQGGKGSEYPLEIGSGSFIPGFEEQIIGHMPGEEFDIEVMFPEQYHSADLAGKPAVFRIYLHKTEEKIVPELNDAFAAAVSEYNTLAEYKEYLRELEVQRREQAAKNAAMEQALQKAIANAQMEEYAATEEYEALVRDAEDQLIGRFEQDLQAQGITMDQYLSMTQETMEGLHRQVHSSAEQKVQAELVLEAVAETEGLDVTEEEVEVAVAQLAAQYQVNLAAMKNALDMDALRQNLRINKAASLNRGQRSGDFLVWQVKNDKKSDKGEHMQSERRKNKGDESVCRVLNEEEMCRIYHEYLPRDFAADEIKPLVLMLDMLHNGNISS